MTQQMAPAGSALLRASHPGPTLAVTALAGLLALGAGLGPGRGVVVVSAVLTGQLSIGWSNDLVDLARDRQVARPDKPLATGEVPVGVVRVACGAALAAAVALPAVLGVLAGPAAAVAGLLVVAGGWAYNLGLKDGVWSWAPYAVAFGALPAFVLLAGDRGVPVWLPVAGALLGVGAHILNVLPDLDDDAATGVRGLPHRLGVRRAAPAGAFVLLAATLVLALGAPITGWTGLLLLLVVVPLATLAALARGRGGFRAAVAIALGDVVLLVGAGV